MACFAWRAAHPPHGGRRSNSRPREMRGFRTCRVCTVYEPFQDMTDECCWIVSGTRCVFDADPNRASAAQPAQPPQPELRRAR